MNYTHLPPTWMERVARQLRWPLTGLAALAALYTVFLIYTAGQTAWAAGALALFGSAFYVYVVSEQFAYRYLYPGVAAMGVFIAFPLVFTAQIGFSNYSSAHLLSEAHARATLLERADPVPEQVRRFTLHADGAAYRLALHAGEDEASPIEWISPPLALKKAATIAMEAPGATALQPALPLKAVVEHREALMQLSLKLPGSSETLRYLGLRDYGPVREQWQPEANGGLLRVEDGKHFTPNRNEGYFEGAEGERLQPGFKVNVGWRNYARMVLDAEFRSPFLSIFVWTVVFALVTVACCTALGMMLAVLLNWEDLKGRTLYRTLVFLPYAVPGFISILVFKGLFNQNFGEINAILNALFGVKPAWFADPLLAKTMLLIVNVWLGYPYVMILCSGLLKSIPADLFEASALAGAGPWTNFAKITAPLIIKPLAPLLVSAFAFNFNNFVLIALLTDGRPDFLSTKIPAGQTDILVSYTYRIAFRDSGSDFGLAAAISTLIFFLVAALSLINLRLSAKAQK